jgi:surface protein
MLSAFFGCSNLNITATDVPNLSGVTNTANMFASCTSLNGPANIGTWNMATVTDMRSMFHTASAFNQPIGTWNTGAVTLASTVFFNATSFNRPLGTWNTAAMTTMAGMFSGATAFNQPLGTWTLNAAVNLTTMLNNCGMDCANYSATLIGWRNNPATPNSRSLGATGRKFETNAVAARTFLDVTKAWTITGDALTTAFFADADGDGFGNAAVSINACSAPSGFVSNSTDCNDANPNVNPGAIEICNGIDDDCNGTIDPGFTCIAPFITTWRTDNPGTSNSTSITIPMFGTIHNYEVDWNNDGIYEQTGITGSVTHDFGVAGTYTVRLRGNFPNIFFNNGGDRQKLLDIPQWGGIAWTFMNSAFFGCSNLNISATDMPNLSGVADMRQIFRNCTTLNGPANIGTWNTANVTLMSNMFNNASSFNQPIGTWNTAKVISMDAMFQGASAFNQPLGTWNTAKVTTMAGMFSGASAFNQPIGTWTLNAAVNLTTMLDNCGMNCSNYSATLIGWSNNPLTPNSRSLGASGRKFETNAVAARTNLDITKAWTFLGDALVSPAFFADTDGDGFGNAAVSQCPCSGIPPVGFVADSTDCNDANAAIKPGATEICNGIDDDCDGSVDDGLFCPDAFITTWKTDNPGTSNSTSITIPTTGIGFNYDADWNNDGTFEQTGITGAVTHDFGVAGTYTIRIRGDVPKIFFANGGDCKKLLDINQWGGIAWTVMVGAFSGCSNLNISATDVPNLSGVTNMDQMFLGCTTLNGPANIGTWNMATVTNMRGMFDKASSFNQPIGSWNTAAVTDMSSMFFDAIAFNQPIGSWNTANVTNMNNMFFHAIAFNQPIGSWNTANVTNMSAMFRFASAFNQPIGTWTLNATVNLTSLLNDCGMDCTNYSATLIGWSNNPATPNGRTLGAAGDFGPGRKFETNAVAARTNLDIAKAWTIIGDGLVPTVFFADADGDGFGNAAITINACSQPSGFVSNSTDCNDANANVSPNATEICNGIDDNCNGIIDEGCTPLAVEFTSITATAKGSMNVINFSTATEKDVKEFAIERSIHNGTWEVIGTKAAIGGAFAAHYIFNDVDPMPLSYYRVRSIETSGKEQISKMVVVKRDGGKLVVNKVFPIPTTEGVTVDFSTSKISTLTVVIMDILGKVIKTETFKTVEGTNLMELNVSNLAQGAYILSLYDGETMVKQRIVKQ